MPESMPSGELALEDLRWLRALARRLVHDDARADDAVQDTLVRTLERRPRDPGALRAWLAAVLRNVLRQGSRGEIRRARREGERPAAGDAPSTLDVVAELSLHRRLVEHVNALEEPYRTAIVLRFLRERPPQDAARELGVPVKTFHTRVERGLARLRERLGRDRAAWAAVLALAPRSPAPLAAGLTPLLLPMKLKSVAIVLGLLLAGVWWRWLREGADARAGIDAPVALATPPAGFEPEPARSSIDAAREPAPATGVAPTARAPELEPARELLHGSVRALDGSGQAGLGVRFERRVDAAFALFSEDPRATSDARGEFALPWPERPGRLTVEDETFAALVRPRVDAQAPLAPPIVVVVPARYYAGRVLDEQGRGIAGAALEITLPGSFVRSIDVGDASLHLLLPFAETESDESGAFSFARAAAMPGARLAAVADGFEPGEIALPEPSSARLELVLLPKRDTARTLHGLVVDAFGAPVEGAQVSLGDDTVASDAGGRFTLEWARWRERGTLRAVKPGLLPAAAPLDAGLLASTPEAPVVLQLGAEPRAIRGRVVDASGEPVAGAIVFSPDSTPFGSVLLREGEHSFLGGTTVEALLTGRGGPWEATLHAECDAEGRFALAGLLDRSYALFALDPRTLAGSGRVDVRADASSARLVLEAVTPRGVAGRVLSRAGAPLADVDVSLGRSFAWLPPGAARDVDWVQLPELGPDAAWTLDEPSTRTDPDGRFALAPLAVEGSFLVLRGRSVSLGERVALDPRGDLEALEVRVDASSRFAIVLAQADEADAFSLEAPDGSALPLFLEVDGGTISAPRAEIAAGRSGPVLASEGEWTVVLHSGERTVRRHALFFPAGGLHELRP